MRLFATVFNGIRLCSSLTLLKYKGEDELVLKGNEILRQEE